MKKWATLALVTLGAAFESPAWATADRYITHGLGTDNYSCRDTPIDCGSTWQCVSVYGSQYVSNSGSGHESGSYVSVYWNTGTYTSPWRWDEVNWTYVYDPTCEYSYFGTYGWAGGDGFRFTGSVANMSIAGAADGDECAYDYYAGTYECELASVAADLNSTVVEPPTRGVYSNSYANPPYYRSMWRSNGQNAASALTGTLTVNGTSAFPENPSYSYGYNWLSNQGYVNIWKDN